MLKHVNFAPIGQGQHRSGWPYCIDALQPLFSPDAEVYFDDFIERSFLYKERVAVPYIGHPWVGVLHHPPDVPTWYMRDMRLQRLLTDEHWKSAVDSLQLIITMADNLHQWVKETWPTIPSVVIRHPTGRPVLEWSPERFKSNPTKRAVQVGWFLRNTALIEQAAVPDWLTKTHLKQDNNWAAYTYRMCHWHYKSTRELREKPQDISALGDTDYDIFLAENVVLIEVMTAVANNAVVECIARNTPICVNRHPGPVYYLGEDYPLFYDRIEDIERVLTMQNILAAHQYLKSMDKWWIRGSMFREQVRHACLQNVPACRVFVSQDDVSCVI